MLANLGAERIAREAREELLKTLNVEVPAMIAERQTAEAAAIVDQISEDIVTWPEEPRKRAQAMLDSLHVQITGAIRARGKG